MTPVLILAAAVQATGLIARCAVAASFFINKEYKHHGYESLILG
jgi:hypothetical protein